MTRGRPWTRIGSLALVAGLAMVLFVQIAAADVAPADVPDELLAAIGDELSATGQEFAGICSEADQGAGAGKYCVSVLTIEGDVAEVAVGPIASGDPTKWTFTRTGSSWTVTANDAGNPGAPQTGSGQANLTVHGSAPSSSLARAAALACVIWLGALAGLRRSTRLASVGAARGGRH